MVGDTAPKRWRIAVDVLAIMIFLSLALSSWAIYTRFQDTNAARRDNRATWHAVICSIEQATLRNPHESQSQKVQSLQFFDGLLVNNIHAAPCGLLGGKQ